jgi:hypothetical protein
MVNGDNSIQYFDWVEYPHARVRVEIEKQGGVPTRFVIQIERRVDDHDPANPMGHDLTEEGLHMDIYRDREKVRVKDDFPPVSLPRAALLYCVHPATR